MVCLMTFLFTKKEGRIYQISLLRAERKHECVKLCRLIQKAFSEYVHIWANIIVYAKNSRDQEKMSKF